MSNLQLDTGSNIDSSSVGSVCHLLEAYENLWVCLEDKKGILFDDIACLYKWEYFVLNI